MSFNRLATKSVVIIAILFGAALTVLAAVSTDFEAFPQGTPAENVNVPGVSFEGLQYLVRNVGDLVTGFSGHGLIGNYDGGPLTISFSAMQSSTSFNYVILENPLQVIVKRNGAVVDTRYFTGDYDPASTLELIYSGFASIQGEFDELVLTDMGSCPGCVGIDNLQPFDADGVTDGPPDDRMNWGYSDASIGILYPGDDAIDLYLVGTGQYIANFITIDDIPDTPPAENTIIRQEGNVTVSILTTGEIHFNLGPDAEGKSYTFIIEDIYGVGAYGSYYDPNE
jgi:hypothetical protein